MPIALVLEENHTIQGQDYALKISYDESLKIFCINIIDDVDRSYVLNVPWEETVKMLEVRQEKIELANINFDVAVEIAKLFQSQLVLVSCPGDQRKKQLELKPPIPPKVIKKRSVSSTSTKKKSTKGCRTKSVNNLSSKQESQQENSKFATLPTKRTRNDKIEIQKDEYSVNTGIEISDEKKQETLSVIEPSRDSTQRVHEAKTKSGKQDHVNDIKNSCVCPDKVETSSENKTHSINSKQEDDIKNSCVYRDKVETSSENKTYSSNTKQEDDIKNSCVCPDKVETSSENKTDSTSRNENAEDTCEDTKCSCRTLPNEIAKDKTKTEQLLEVKGCEQGNGAYIDGIFNDKTKRICDKQKLQVLVEIKKYQDSLPSKENKKKEGSQECITEPATTLNVYENSQEAKSIKIDNTQYKLATRCIERTNILQSDEATSIQGIKKSNSNSHRCIEGQSKIYGINETSINCSIELDTCGTQSSLVDVELPGAITRNSQGFLIKQELSNTHISTISPIKQMKNNSHIKEIDNIERNFSNECDVLRVSEEKLANSSLDKDAKKDIEVYGSMEKRACKLNCGKVKEPRISQNKVEKKLLQTPARVPNKTVEQWNISRMKQPRNSKSITEQLSTKVTHSTVHDETSSVSSCLEIQSRLSLSKPANHLKTIQSKSDKLPYATGEAKVNIKSCGNSSSLDLILSDLPYDTTMEHEHDIVNAPKQWGNQISKFSPQMQDNESDCSKISGHFVINPSHPKHRKEVNRIPSNIPLGSITQASTVITLKGVGKEGLDSLTSEISAKPIEMTMKNSLESELSNIDTKPVKCEELKREEALRIMKNLHGISPHRMMNTKLKSPRSLSAVDFFKSKKGINLLDPELDRMDIRKKHSINSYRKLGYSTGTSSYIQYWETILCLTPSLFSTSALLKRAITEVQSSNAFATIEEAYCALSECNGIASEASGKLNNEEYYQEIQTVCNILDVESFFASSYEKIPKIKSPIKRRTKYDFVSFSKNWTENNYEGHTCVNNIKSLLKMVSLDDYESTTGNTNIVHSLRDNDHFFRRTSETNYRINSLIDMNIQDKAEVYFDQCFQKIDNWGSAEIISSKRKTGKLYSQVQIAQKSYFDALRYSR